jgi:hypothetical protein
LAWWSASRMRVMRPPAARRSSPGGSSSRRRLSARSMGLPLVELLSDVPETGHIVIPLP